MNSIGIKIGRAEYYITEDDIFLNNGSCVQLLTQSKEKSDWGRRPNPVLSKRVIKQISLYHKTPEPEKYKSVKFSLVIPIEEF